MPINYLAQLLVGWLLSGMWHTEEGLKNMERYLDESNVMQSFVCIWEV